jgi:hypothetical protein
MYMYILIQEEMNVKPKLDAGLQPIVGSITTIVTTTLLVWPPLDVFA